MIAVSDVVLIVVTTVALGTGLYRWKNNVEQATQPAVPAETRMQSSASSANDSQATAIVRPQTTDADSSMVGNDDSATRQSQGSTATGAQGLESQTPNREQPAIVVLEQTSTKPINVADDTQTTASNSAVVDVGPYGTHTVEPGDSLSQIALEYNTSVRALQDINGIEGALITVGQEIRYPTTADGS